ncbi:helicase-exonuclease AddAB subunit AddA [Clostridiaceae bacterium 35-E11]
MVKWTKEQWDAIDARGSNLLVAAAAGSGKTAVLVERIIQIITKDKIDIDKLLIVTFTNAAAGEMRERIGAAILQELEKKNENEDHLRRQMNLLNRASISTLHSFCIDVVRRYFHLIDIDPNFRIGDGTETSIMKMEVLEELFEEEYGKEDARFLGLVERFGGSKEDIPLQELVLSLYEFIQSQPYPMQWLAEKIEAFQLDAENFRHSPWHHVLVEQIGMDLAGAKEIFMEAKKLCELPGGPTGYKEAIINDISLVEELLNRLKNGLKFFYDGLETINHKRLGRLGKDVDDILKEKVKAQRQQGKDIIKDIQEKVLPKDPIEYVKNLNELYPYMHYLYELVKGFEELYHDKKVEKGIVDFSDLEHYALAILDNAQVAKEYQDKFAHIFVDEYQDSNIVQETILSFIRKKNNFFMVGDVKQSIYRFRLADPSLFIEKYETFENALKALNCRIDLSKNFRSREEVIHGVNFIFKHIMSKQFGEIDYDEKAYLYQGATTQPIEDPNIEINIIEKKVQTNEMEEALEELEDMEVEARITAKRLKQLLDTTIYDQKLEQYRNLGFRDIVVLLRTTKNWAQTFLEVFIEEGIPAYADVNAGYFEAIEVNIFMNLLKVIDNKRQDIPLLSVMRSPIGGFSTQELINIRAYSKAATYFEAIESYQTQMTDELKEKCAVFLEKIQAWKEASRYLHIDRFIWKLLMDTGYYDYVGAMPGGIQRQANLRVLIDRARQFQKTSMKGLFHFIKFVDKLKSSSGDMGTAKTLGENEDVVRIMSIHKSKGLEFPVVIVAGMGKQFNLRDTHASVLFHKDLGIGPKYVDPELRQYGDTIAKVAMTNQIKLESLSEEMRILYVAFTRAKEKLILVGSVRDIERTAKKWTNPVNPFHLSKARSYLDWVGPVVMRHRDGELLREWAEVDWTRDVLFEDSSKWKITKFKKTDINIEEMEKKMSKLAFLQYLKNFEHITSSEDGQWVKQRLDWQYPYQIATKIPSKLSVTEIKRISVKELNPMNMHVPALVQRPKFMEGKKQFTGMEKGIIIHFAMQHLNIEKVDTKEAIELQIENMVTAELLKPEEANVVDILKIQKFFQSAIGQRIIKAKKVFREVPFNFVKKACEITLGLEDCEESLLVQGVIDCYFEEEDGFVLVDYKTDYAGLGNKEEIVNKYRVQIELYKEALEKITRKTVKESYLYLFYLDEEVKI